MNEFDSQLHIYRVDKRRVPSVTQILKATGISVNFDRFDPKAVEFKQKVGIAVHASIHYLNEGTLDDSTIDQQYVAPRLEGYYRFCKDTGFEAIGFESLRWPCVNNMRYGMRLDVTGTIKGEPWLIDWKVSDGSPQYSWSVQTSAYELGIERPLVPPFRYRRASLQLPENGRYNFHEWSDKGDADEFKWALALVYRRLNRGENIWL